MDITYQDLWFNQKFDIKEFLYSHLCQKIESTHENIPSSARNVINGRILAYIVDDKVVRKNGVIHAFNAAKRATYCRIDDESERFIKSPRVFITGPIKSIEQNTVRIEFNSIAIPIESVHMKWRGRIVQV